MSPTSSSSCSCDPIETRIYIYPHPHRKLVLLWLFHRLDIGRVFTFLGSAINSFESWPNRLRTFKLYIFKRFFKKYGLFLAHQFQQSKDRQWREATKSKHFLLLLLLTTTLLNDESNTAASENNDENNDTLRIAIDHDGSTGLRFGSSRHLSNWSKSRGVATVEAISSLTHE